MADLRAEMHTLRDEVASSEFLNAYKPDFPIISSALFFVVCILDDRKFYAPRFYPYAQEPIPLC